MMPVTAWRLTLSNILKLDPTGTRSKKATGDALITLQGMVAEDMNKVNAIILKMMESQVVLIPQLAGHLIASGGKRLRPMLTLAAAQMVRYEGTRHCHLAACVEFIHTATLLHDDVVDESELRRGKDSANTIWGNKPSVLVGDFLFSKAFEIMVADGSLKVLKILSGASSIIAEGEVMQLMTTNDVETSEDAYMEVINAKTAGLFAAACEIAPVVADRPVREEKALKSYGKNLGIAFQLIDDALDYSAKQAVLGKTVGDDFREGKITLPIILAYNRGTSKERTFWRRVMEGEHPRDEDLGLAMDYMNKHNTLSETVDRARHFGAKARDALSIFPGSEAKTALIGIVDFCVDRAY